MKDIFTVYFGLGWDHILAWGAWDHQLFMLALIAIYTFRQWKQVLILVTAFTIGHSLTLALSVFNIVRFNDAWIEFLIPVTIAITALSNVIGKHSNTRLQINYYLALFFGLIHGMGFANGLRSLLGKEESLLMPLLGFNLGLEAGQLVIVLAILLAGALVTGLLRMNQRDYISFLSGGAFLASLIMAFDRIPW